jgi:hypothetical protein
MDDSWEIEVTFQITAEGRTAIEAWESIRHRFPQGFPKIQLSDLHISKVRTLPPACDTCNDTGLVDWMIEGDPNLYQEPDADGKIPCPDCDPTRGLDPESRHR